MHKPAKKPRKTIEHQHQVMLVRWADARKIPLVAIPNGGDRHVLIGIQMKEEGVRPGFPDIIIPLQRQGYGALFIEMKSPQGKVRPNQQAWIDFLREQGYAVEVCYGYEQAVEVIKDYLEE